MTDKQVFDVEAAKKDICELEREFYDLVKHSRRGNDYPPVEKCKMPCKSFVEGWPLLQTAVDRLINQIGGGVDNSGFTAQEYMSYYTTVFELCTGRMANENSKLLYAQYKDVFENYINSRVLPSLEEKKGELLLRELLIRWSNHKIMTSWLVRIFRYLDRNDIPGQRLPSLEKTSFLSFYELVCGRMEKQVMDAIIAMVFSVILHVYMYVIYKRMYLGCLAALLFSLFCFQPSMSLIESRTDKRRKLIFTDYNSQTAEKKSLFNTELQLKKTIMINGMEQCSLENDNDKQGTRVPSIS